MKYIKVLESFGIVEELDTLDYMDVAEDSLLPLTNSKKISQLYKLFKDIERIYYPSIRFHNAIDQERYLKEFYEPKYSIPYSSLESLLKDCELVTLSLFN